MSGSKSSWKQTVEELSFIGFLQTVPEQSVAGEDRSLITMSGSKSSTSMQPMKIVLQIGGMTVVPEKSGTGKVGYQNKSQISYSHRATNVKKKVVTRTNHKSVTTNAKTNHKSVTTKVKKEKVVTSTNRKSVATNVKKKKVVEQRVRNVRYNNRYVYRHECVCVCDSDSDSDSDSDW